MPISSELSPEQREVSPEEIQEVQKALDAYNERARILAKVLKENTDTAEGMRILNESREKKLPEGAYGRQLNQTTKFEQSVNSQEEELRQMVMNIPGAHLEPREDAPGFRLVLPNQVEEQPTIQ